MSNNKPQFRPSPTRVQNSIKILAGTKTNATIRDIEEEVKDDDKKGELEEKIGTVSSIIRDKINGDGWIVKCDDGQSYHCSCANSMYDIPSSVERGGVLYPSTTVQVKFTVSKVLRRNTITEIISGLDDDTGKSKSKTDKKKDNSYVSSSVWSQISSILSKYYPSITSQNTIIQNFIDAGTNWSKIAKIVNQLGGNADKQNTVIKLIQNANKSTSSSSSASKDKKNDISSSSSGGKLDISKWRHGEEATTIIAKPKSAISISNSLISFNYENTNGPTIERENLNINKDGVSANGSKMEINTNETAINSDRITVNGKDVKDVAKKNIQDKNKKDGAVITSNQQSPNIIVQRTQNIVQLNITNLELTVNKTERVIADIKDSFALPIKKQTFGVASSVLVTDKEETPINTDIITVYSNGVITIKTTENEGKHKISSSHNWITNIYNPRNIITITQPATCSFCTLNNASVIEDSYAYANYCPNCGEWNVLSILNNQIYCSSCGEIFCGVCSANINTNEPKIKNYEIHKVQSKVSSCEDCNINAVSEVYRYYMDYCPNCGKWDILIPVEKDGKYQFYCPSCQIYYCTCCGSGTIATKDEQKKYKNFVKNIISYDDYKNSNNKIIFSFQEEV